VTLSEVLDFMRLHRHAVQTSVSTAGVPQAAVVGVVVSDRLEVVFDTLDSTRKVQNLRRSPKIALVFGGLLEGEERTVQYEGVADEPQGEELERLKRLYYKRFPDGRDRLDWPGLVYVRARPSWIRYSDYREESFGIFEYDATAIEAWLGSS
jgi:general stress protein 26